MTPELAAVADRYLHFAEIEARGVSAVFDGWATGLADDESLLGLLAPLPRIKQQPNLVFAATRWTGCPAGPFDAFRDWMLETVAQEAARGIAEYYRRADVGVAA